MTVKSSYAKCTTHVSCSDFFFFEHLFHELVVKCGENVKQLCAVLVGLVLVLSRDLNNFELLALVIVVDRCSH